ncbi:MAG: NAD-dependent epimerase/dehydratase family protein [bacterium]|nr:NAD-dependent epimerase/dehydratase family protein [bacterium]
MTKKPTILITGSSGTIGTRLCEILLKEGYSIIGVDRKPNKWVPSLNTITEIRELLTPDPLNGFPKVDMIIHLAANARVYDLVKNPELAMENTLTTFNVLEFARQNNIKKVIFASSREVYGNDKDKIFPYSCEFDAEIDMCESSYAASKIFGETMLRAYKACYGINFLILRFSNVYGMYDDSDRFIPMMIRKMKQNKPVSIYGAGKMLDFTYIDDAINGIILSIRSFDTKQNQVFNIASGEGSHLTLVAKKLKKLLNSKSKINIKQSRAGEVHQFIADLTSAKKRLGYKPTTDLNTGLKKTIEWYSEKGL